jgi:hypothetical protein
MGGAVVVVTGGAVVVVTGGAVVVVGGAVVVGAVTVTVCCDESVPPLLATVSRTRYVPGAVNVWAGLLADEVEPSPKLHAHEVGFPVDWSVNWAGWGAVPEREEAVKRALGAWTLSVTVITCFRYSVSLPTVLRTVSRTPKIPGKV